MAENIFNEKQDYIVAARDEVIKRDEYAANIDRMKQQQKKLSRSIASEEGGEQARQEKRGAHGQTLSRGDEKPAGKR